MCGELEVLKVGQHAKSDILMRFDCKEFDTWFTLRYDMYAHIEGSWRVGGGGGGGTRSSEATFV